MTTPKDSVTGILAQVQKFGEWSSASWRNLLAASFGVVVLVVSAVVFMAVMNPNRTFQTLDQLSNHDLEEAMQQRALEDHGVEVDHFISKRVRWTRQKLGAARAVARAYVFSRNAAGQIIGVTDVFENMDPTAESAGLRNRYLPLEAIAQTVEYMGSHPGDPECIAADVDDYDDPALREFLASGGLEASAACPILNEHDEIVGLFAVSVRSPLNKNPKLVKYTRDTSLRIGGYVDQSPTWAAAIAKKSAILEDNPQ